MPDITAYHQLGRFIVEFQATEALLNEVMALIANSDHEAVSILANDLEYSRRLKTADVLFARFVGLMGKEGADEKTEFHAVMSELLKLGERRNSLVHSSYFDWMDSDGKLGLLRKHSKLEGKNGQRKETVEELQPDAFSADLESIARARARLENLRLKSIEWLHPIEA